MSDFPAVTFTGFLVHLQAVSSRAGAVKANFQIAAIMGAATISSQTLVVVCRYPNTQRFQIASMTTIFLIVARFHSELIY